MEWKIRGNEMLSNVIGMVIEVVIGMVIEVVIGMVIEVVIVPNSIQERIDM